MDNKKIIIFDFDGVIADSLPLALEVNRLSRPTLTSERYQAAFDGNINDARYEDKVVRQIDFIAEYGKRFVMLGIDPEKKKIIQQLASEFPLFIISSTVDRIINDFLVRHEIAACFTTVLGNDVATSKVEKFALLLARQQVATADVIFITDSAGDVKEAKAAGIKTIVGILGGYQTAAALEKSEPTVIVENFSQFYDFVHQTINKKSAN